MPDTDQPESDATPDEPVEVEVVDRTEIEPAAPQSSLDRAAEYAMTNPGAPGVDEFLALAMQARILSMSELAPKDLKGKPAAAFHVGMIARDLGLSISAGLNLVDVIDGQPSLSPQLRLAQIKRNNLGSIVPAVRNPDRSVAVALAPGGQLDPRCRAGWPDHVDDCRCAGFIGDVEFTWEDARRAGFIRSDCEATRHSDECEALAKHSDWQKRKRACKANYRTYPARMLWWRAAGWAADDYFPEAAVGLYSPDEMGALTDHDGRPIDPATVELPEGYGPRQIAAAEPEEASDEVRAAIQTRIDALTDGAKAALKRLWTGEDGGEDARRLRPVAKLMASEVVIAEAMLTSIEKRAEAGEWAESTGDPILDTVVADVRAMTPAKITEELARRQVEVEGNMQAKRAALAQRLYLEATGEPFDVDDTTGVGAPSGAEQPQDAPPAPTVDGGGAEHLRGELVAMSKRQLIAVAHRFFIQSTGTVAELVDRIVADLPNTNWAPGMPLLPDHDEATEAPAEDAG